MRSTALAFLLLFNTHLLADNCEHDATTFRCVKYVKNYDADTITFDIPNVHPLIGHHISVRVRHVDTPEIKGKLPCEKEVARTAKRLIENQLKSAKRIDLTDVDKDKYFRILANVIVDGKSIKDSLLKNNLAYAYEGALFLFFKRLTSSSLLKSISIYWINSKKSSDLYTKFFGRVSDKKIS